MVSLRETEVILRLSIVFILLIASCLIGLGSQTKEIAYIYKKVTYRDLLALEVGLYINIVVATYNIIQVGFGWFGVVQNTSNFKWLSYIADQMVVYVMLAGTSAGAEHALLVLTGSMELQWMKWCYKYTRFCFQIGSAIVVNYFAVVLMLLLSSLSAFNLFRLYSPKHFLHFKSPSPTLLN